MGKGEACELDMTSIDAMSRDLFSHRNNGFLFSGFFSPLKFLHHAVEEQATEVPVVGVSEVERGAAPAELPVGIEAHIARSQGKASDMQLVDRIEIAGHSPAAADPEHLLKPHC